MEQIFNSVASICQSYTMNTKHNNWDMRKHQRATMEVSLQSKCILGSYSSLSSRNITIFIITILLHSQQYISQVKLADAHILRSWGQMMFVVPTYF